MDVLEGVDWIAMGKFLKRHHPIECCKIVQTMHDWQNMGSQKQQFLQAHESQCINKNGAECSVSHANFVECPL
jgi:hypothetical protein